MERSESLKPADPSNNKYNLRCNRNISEKMTKKDFIYDIPAPFQAMRKEKCLQSTLKKPRGDFESLISSNGVDGSQVKSCAGKMDGKLNKDRSSTIGVVRLIQRQKLIPGSVKTGCSKSLKVQLSEKEEEMRIETEGEIRRQIVLPIQLRRSIGSDSKPPRYSVIPTCTEEHELNNSTPGNQLPERKILGYQCNYCHERIATLLSLSTHVKYHCELYCNICFWILGPEESITQHLQKAHSIPDRIS